MYLKATKNIIIISLMMLLSACTSNSSPSGETSEQTSRKMLDSKTKASLVMVFKSNENLFQNFFNYNSKKVETAAKNLKAAIEKVKDPEISKLLQSAKIKLTEITANNDTEVNNQKYHLVSMALIQILSTYDTGRDYNAYSCPMVKKSWVQNTEKSPGINNPYAPGMPHCGSQDSNY